MPDLVSDTLTSNAFDGLDLICTADVEVEAPVAPPPAAYVAPVHVEKAIPLPLPTLVNGRPTAPEYQHARGFHITVGTDQVVVGGRDITWFRADDESPHQPTIVPGYDLIEPLGYGPSEPLVIPRTNCNFERPGVGDLAWMVEGARVQYRRRKIDGTTVDYRGRVMAIRYAGVNFVLDIAGEVEGPAELALHKQPVVWIQKDLGHWVSLALADIGIHMNPPLGPVLNRKISDGPESTLRAWLSSLSRWSQQRDGRQRAIMPATWGGSTYRFDLKDTTSKDFTVFADGDRIRIDLVDDVTEKPTTFYGTGIAPNGVRWCNRRMPGIFDGPPAPYPFADDRNFGLGTTDADTDTGDGITVLRINLLWFGFLDVGDSVPTDEYTDAMYDAVQELKSLAGLSDNGTMTTAAWDALFNIDTTGFSNQGSTMFPLVEDPKVRRWNYSSDGAIIGRNPARDPKKLRVDLITDYGGGISKKAATNFERGRYARTQGKNLPGSITLGAGITVFAGEHDNDDYDALDASDVMSARDIRPGMNAWLPYVDNGTLEHVARVQVSSPDEFGNRSVTLTVDTQGRDYLELTEVLERRKNTRRNPRREWERTNQANKPSGSLIVRDELFGIRPQDKALTGDQWNIVYVPIGQMGNVNRTYLELFDDEAEYAVAIVGREWKAPRFQRIFGNPLAPVDEETGETWMNRDRVQSLLEDHIVLFAAGTADQPLGYSHRNKFGRDGNPTGAPLTGKLFDDMSWPYLSIGYRRPVVAIGIYPDRNCTLRGGRFLYALEDDVV